MLDNDSYDDHIESVHPALKVKIQNLTASYKGWGLQIEDHYYHHNIRKYLPLLEPIRGKNNRILKNQPRIQARPLKWWKAQCAFRGLETTGKALLEFQTKLRPNPNA